MSRLTRAIQKIFGASAGTNQLAKIGSFAAAAPVFTTDPVVMQALTQYDSGLFSVVTGVNSPAIEDINSLFFLATRQIAYLMQLGIAEWDSTTTYYIGSIVQDGTGILYISITDNNTGNAVSSSANWKRMALGANVAAVNPATDSPKTLIASDNGKTFNVNSVNGAMTITLPAASANYSFSVKDVGGVASTSNITIARAAAESIEGQAASFVCAADYGNWTFTCDGTNWWLEP